MSHLHHCPNCLYVFVHRKFDRDKSGLRCRRCHVQIVHLREGYIQEDKMFLCLSKGSERAIRPWDSTTESWGELIDLDALAEDKKYHEWDGEKLVLED
jgi:hypothetical protein